MFIPTKKAISQVLSYVLWHKNNIRSLKLLEWVF